MNRTTMIYLGGLLVCFVVGAYAWKILNTGRFTVKQVAEVVEERQFQSQATIVFVDEVPITQDDVEWEFKLNTNELLSADDLTAIPELGDNPNKYLGSLKERIVSALVERKLLYAFIKQDASFDLTDPKRFMECLKDWQETINEANGIIVSADDRERLKNRLCEKSVLKQYLEERVFTRVQISDKEIEAYFEDNISMYTDPERVEIRQIVMPSETDAKQISARLNRNNFAQVAESSSITPEAENGGLLGPFARGEMPSVLDVAFSMQKGEISTILKSTYGFHIIMLEKKYPKVKLGLAEAKPRIEKKLRSQKEEEEYQKWVETALNAISVKTPKPLW